MIPVRKALRHSKVLSLCDADSYPSKLYSQTLLIVPEQPEEIKRENKNRKTLERAAFPDPCSPYLCQYQGRGAKITHWSRYKGQQNPCSPLFLGQTWI